MPSSNPGMEVCFAQRVSDGLRVVVKIRGKPGSFACPEEEREWRQTTEFMLSLPDCDHRAKLIEVFEDKVRYYIVMECVAGLDLYELVDQNGQLPLAECKDILRQTLAAVAELHARGLIHKDLKLENIMVNSESSQPASPMRQLDTTCSTRASSEAEQSPKLKLVDFDTVEEYIPKESGTARTVVGTDQYIAQEAYAGKYSPASDVFAVGVITYRLLTGRFPFKRNTFDDQLGENWVGSPKMKQIQARLRQYRVNFQLLPFQQDPQAKDFCEALLAVDEFDRPSAVEALKHPFLAPPTPPRTASPKRTASGWLPYGS